MVRIDATEISCMYYISQVIYSFYLKVFFDTLKVPWSPIGITTACCAAEGL